MSDKPAFDVSAHLTPARKNGPANYLQVKWRLVWLRSEHPDATIETECLAHSGEEAVFRAIVSIPGSGSATGHGSETRKDFADYVEKAETKAIGRALAALGYGAEHSDDFDQPANTGNASQTRQDRPQRTETPRRAPDTTPGVPARPGPNTRAGGYLASYDPNDDPGDLATERQGEALIRLAEKIGFEDPLEASAIAYAKERIQNGGDIHAVAFTALTHNQAAAIISALQGA